MRFILLLSVLLSGFAAQANPLEDYLTSSRWCFKDTQGDWDHGRFEFQVAESIWDDNTAKFDVTDAPAPGWVDYKWDSILTISGYYRITLTNEFGTKVRADVEMRPQTNEMVWYWLRPMYAKSYLQRCP